MADKVHCKGNQCTLCHLANSSLDAEGMFGWTQAWQQAANVEVTVEKAPRWRRVDSCSNDRSAIW